MRAHGMVYFLFNAHQNANYCIPEGHGSATLFTRPFLPFCIGGAGHETNILPTRRMFDTSSGFNLSSSHFLPSLTHSLSLPPLESIMISEVGM